MRSRSRHHCRWRRNRCTRPLPGPTLAPPCRGCSAIVRPMGGVGGLSPLISAAPHRARLSSGRQRCHPPWRIAVSRRARRAPRCRRSAGAETRASSRHPRPGECLRDQPRRRKGGRPRTSRPGKQSGRCPSEERLRRPTLPVERMEAAVLTLAGELGLRASSVELALAATPYPVALIQRFDRVGGRRVHYVSARTFLGFTGNESAYYADLADVMRSNCGSGADLRNELRELHRRIMFSILVSNDDDHLKNHGFLYAGDGAWRLSPAFDINPNPDSQRRAGGGGRAPRRPEPGQGWAPLRRARGCPGDPGTVGALPPRGRRPGPGASRSDPLGGGRPHVRTRRGRPRPARAARRGAHWRGLARPAARLGGVRPGGRRRQCWPAVSSSRSRRSVRGAPRAGVRMPRDQAPGEGGGDRQPGIRALAAGGGGAVAGRAGRGGCRWRSFRFSAAGSRRRCRGATCAARRPPGGRWRGFVAGSEKS